MKKTWNIVKNIFVWLVVAAAVAMVIFTVVSVLTFDRNDRAIFGYKAFIVKSDSMKATHFAAGDLVLIKEVNPSTLQEGDVISFQSTNSENYGEVVTHMIKRRAQDAEGNPGFITYGTTTGVEDSSMVLYDFVLGKYTGKLPGVGNFFFFLKTTPGYILCIFLPFLLLIVVQGINSIRLFRQYKAEQLAEVEAEREKERAAMAEERERLEEERLESRKLLEELQRLQAQLVNQTGEAKEEKPEE